MPNVSKRQPARGAGAFTALAMLLLPLLVGAAAATAHAAPVLAAVIDNSDITPDDGPPFEKTDGWTFTKNSESFNGNHLYNTDDNTIVSATWTFVGLEPGSYDVFATWTPNANRSTEAPFTLGINGPEVLLNQEIEPGRDANDDLLPEGERLSVLDDQDTSHLFTRLGTVAISDGAGEFVVTLNDDGVSNLTSYVIADAVALVVVPTPSAFGMAIMLFAGMSLRRPRR